MSNFAIPGGEMNSCVQHAKWTAVIPVTWCLIFPSSGMDVLNIWGEVLLTLRIHQGESYLDSAAIYFTKSSGCSAQYIRWKSEKGWASLPAVCMVVMVVVVVTVVDVVVVALPSWAAGFESRSVWSGPVLFFTSVSLASPFSILIEDGARVASVGKALQLRGRPLCVDEEATGLFSPSEPLLFGVTWVVRESVVGSTLSCPLIFSSGDFFWGKDMGGLGVVGENVVSGVVAAAVAVVAMSEKAGASSWGTSWVTEPPGSDTEPGTVEYAATEPSLLKKCWSPWKSLVSRCSWSSMPLKTGWWFGMFTGGTVVTAWTSLSVSIVDVSLSGYMALLLTPRLSLGPKGWENRVVLSWILQASELQKQRMVHKSGTSSWQFHYRIIKPAGL